MPTLNTLYALVGGFEIQAHELIKLIDEFPKNK
jgi:hypothetical protein